MDKIDGIILKDCVSEAEKHYVEEQRQIIIGQIQSYMLSEREISRDLAFMRKQMKEKEEKLSRISNKIKQVREENWDVLQLEKKE